MNYIYANISLGIKILLKDKISLGWGAALPVILFFLNRESITEEYMLMFWYTYIVINFYIFGVGVYAMESREVDILKTIFSLKNEPFLFFISNLLTQVIYSTTVISILNVVATITNNFNYIYISFLGIKTIILCIPVAFLFYNVTLINFIQPSSLKSILTAIIFILLMMLGYKQSIFNPFYFLPIFFYEMNKYEFSIYIIISTLVVIFSMYSVLNFEPLRLERRSK